VEADASAPLHGLVRDVLKLVTRHLTAVVGAELGYGTGVKQGLPKHSCGVSYRAGYGFSGEFSPGRVSHSYSNSVSVNFYHKTAAGQNLVLYYNHMHEDSAAAVTATKVRVVREGVHALSGVSFALSPGKITGLIGPSGSGKTTLMRCIVGAQQLTSGSLEVLGLPAGAKQLRTRIGYVTQSPAVYDDLTAAQNLHYFARILGTPKDDVSRALKEVDMMRQAGQVVGAMSGGQRARVSLAVALLGNPELLVLDEPTVGLDPVLREKLWQLFADIAAEGRTLIISSHVMDEAERCPELLLLRDGKVLSHGAKQELLHATNTKDVQAAFLKLAGGATA
jgi:ABC-2 type transport system ATP-binding protein